MWRSQRATGAQSERGLERWMVLRVSWCCWGSERLCEAVRVRAYKTTREVAKRAAGSSGWMTAKKAVQAGQGRLGRLGVAHWCRAHIPAPRLGAPSERLRCAGDRAPADMYALSPCLPLAAGAVPCHEHRICDRLSPHPARECTKSPILRAASRQP